MIHTFQASGALSSIIVDLEDIPSDIGNIGGLQLIELVDCSPSAVKSTRTIKKQQKDLKKGFQVRIYSSWE
ncbi:hypothetical protein PHJA_002339000 [Phtheirospermum japonicum]|uniref:Uncharacterized protein n=1 Tax=Phtheirospermum japonicum TaxID=374723 RepID=A0A830CPY9_9LAMI|nr:hypothetical protein PHJA_002339000 [Phtheirospermum japonicum]